MSELEKRSGGLVLPEPSDVVASVAKAALAAAFRVAQPESREKFETPPDRPVLRRLYYTTEDGWQAPLFRLEAPPGATGEPVIVAHGLGINRHAVDYGPDLSLARAIRDAGFEVFLLEHRGDASAIAPPRARGFDFDDIAAQDIPAAIDRVRADTGFGRVLFVGHAMGGQLLYAHLAHSRGDDVAGAVALCAAVEFERDPRRRLQVLRALMPRRWALPTRLIDVLTAPQARSSVDVAGELERGLRLHASQDVGVGVARQALVWLEAGVLCDRHNRLDYIEALAGVATPTLVLAASDDQAHPAHRCVAVLDQLPGKLHVVQGSHLAPLLGDARHEAWEHVIGWLEEHRKDCW